MIPAPLILVVGPSGAGKDSLMDGARQSLAGDGRFHFARRMVTRPAGAGGEDHDSLGPEEFERLRAQGGFMLSWSAHGLSYGIPDAVQARRRQGVAVVANVSRGVVEAARGHLAPVGIIVVTAPAEVLAARLRGRGREDIADIHDRLERATAAMPEGADVRRVVNDASLKVGIGRFLTALEDLSVLVGKTCREPV